jgi:hypothetical protein
MNTPAHIVVNLLALDRKESPGRSAPVFWGSVIPDAPMVLFYTIEKLVHGLSEKEIWTRAYFDAGWQTFFDLFNSIPIAVLLLAVGRRFRNRWAVWVSASVLLHIALDLPFHHDDAHGHFFPLSDWRFQSPVSYWNPEYYGVWMAAFETTIVLAGSVILFRRSATRLGKAAVAFLPCVYAAYWAFAFMTWA